MHAQSLKNCPRCSMSNEIIAQFCFACGAPVRKKSNRWAIVLLCSTFVAFFAFVSFAIYAARKNASSNPSRSSQTTYNSTATRSPSAPNGNAATDRLIVVTAKWEKGGFDTVALWRVTFKNVSDQSIGDIQYRTAYYSETGNLVDKGGVDSILDKKVVQKVVPPNSTRTIEINDGFLHSEAHRATFDLVGCRFIADSR